MKRKYLALLASISVIALVVFVILLTAGRSRINQENFGLITKGMTKAAVLRILGPPGGYGGGSEEMIGTIGDPLDPAIYLNTHYECLNWHSGRHFIQLYFDKDETVIAGSFSVIVDEVEVVRPNPLERLLRAVGF